MKWFDRKFEFTFSADYLPSILERLSGTPARLEEKLSSIPKIIHSNRFDNAWSIKENIGHLIDLEPLWITRVEQILEGEEQLMPTDLRNRKTDEANHNAVKLSRLLLDFRKIRQQFVELLKSVPKDKLENFALHPRLQQPMRIIDIAYFTAEHDDHHLARITEISNHLM
ncbi:DinB family protein [Solitalea koreensis]|uniref:DinB superfamily protein n=1 Tax=Solitalea koreensis TaxID=543615 RepID=A0A521C8U1_9SPHI|nr:DinB family protein [Solitalea koreensis]SMO55912.1 DinB superfamily protein [Solitalea koreensis]